MQHDTVAGAGATGKVRSAREAALLVRSGDTVATGGFVGIGFPEATTSYPGQCGSTWLGSVASQVSDVSCFRRAIVGDPTTSPPAASRMPLV